jgi:5S rRNA maturation endonuclease (ribonuclease M5)
MPHLLFLTGMLLMAASIPLSEFGMSLSQFIMAGAWLLDRNYKIKLHHFFTNRAALLWCGLYGLHLLGSLWSSDMEYLLKDLRIKLPVLLLPFLFASFPEMIRKHHLIVFKTFVLATAVSTFISTGIWLEIFPYKNHITDIRQISIFISHIRLSLCVVFSFFLLLRFVSMHFHRKEYLLLAAEALLALWFVVFLFLLESLTGLFILFFCLILILFFVLLRKRLYTAALLSLVFITLSSVAGVRYLLISLKKSHVAFDISSINKDEKTKSGNPYYHCFECDETENGNPVYIYINEAELEQTWNERSKIRFNDFDRKGNQLKYTLIRYLSSKGLRKDKEGVLALNQQDIQAIENGVANVSYNKTGSLWIRIRKTIDELKLYQSGKNPSGSSLIQRLEFWKAGFSIFKDHLIFGTGTGDVQKAFHEKYIELNSPLDEKWRLRAHNQYLTFALTFGITGLIYFLITLFYPVLKFKSGDAAFLIFMAIAALSFVNEDTLETQAGVTFIMFFMSLFIAVKADFRPSQP